MDSAPPLISISDPPIITFLFYVSYCQAQHRLYRHHLIIATPDYSLIDVYILLDILGLHSSYLGLDYLELAPTPDHRPSWNIRYRRNTSHQTIAGSTQKPSAAANSTLKYARSSKKPPFSTQLDGRH